MSRFNVKSKPAQPDTVNKAGGSAYKESDKLHLTSILLTSFLNDKYYSKANTQLAELKGAFKNLSDKKFAAKAAIFARNEFGMRSITHALAGEIAHSVKGETWTKNFFKKVIARPDDMLELLTYYLKSYGQKCNGNKLRPIPNAIKKAFKEILESTKANGGFDAYQLAKYRKAGHEMSLVDVVNLVHPNTKLNPAVHQLVKDELRVTGKTWESKISAAGASDDVEQAKSDAWESLLSEGKLGYMALVKNLRNIANTKNTRAIELAAKELVNVPKIKNSKVFPFRLYLAYQELVKANAPRKLLDALHDAVDISLSNIPALEGKTLIALDVSGSMSSGISENRELSVAKVASMFAAAFMKHLPDADLMTFAYNGKYIVTNSRMSTLNLADSLVSAVGGGTSFPSIFNTANKKYDRIFILSDMQSWLGETQTAFRHYKSRFNANPYLYCFDFAGYGTLQFPESKVCTLAGFSDRILDLISINEADRNVLINKIEAVDL